LKGGIFLSAKIINYFACANSALGFASFFEDNLKELDKLYILKGGPGTGKSTLMKAIGKEWYRRGFDVEYIHCASDNNSIDGVIIPLLGIGVVDGTTPHIIEPRAPGAIEEYVNLGEAWDSKKLAVHRDEILDIKNKISSCYLNAYKQFKESLKIHDEWEKIYLDNTDFNKLNEITNAIIDDFFENKHTDKRSIVKNRFLGGPTPKGPVDFVLDLTKDVGKRYFIKGRPGSGKSTLLKKVASEAEERGFDVEIYHCGFEPKSLDMVIIRELDIAIFDSNAPHEYFPTRESDEIIDVYYLAIKPETDEKYKTQLDSIVSCYNFAVGNGINHLANAKQFHDDLESYYIAAMDFNVVDKISLDLIAKMDDYFFSLS
jgi:Cdc6-like AAA superfamily ATPase